jgi:thiol-disulfide isomerase/thioredoxin
MSVRRYAAILLLAASSLRADLVADVRAAAARSDFAGAEKQVAAYRAAKGVTPEMLEALSWLGRGALAAKRLDEADKYADETYKLALEQLKSRKLDAERRLPIALGAAIEVRAQVLAARGERSEALAFLNRELKTYFDTSIRTRIQKNLNLLTLEGQPAPALEVAQWLGERPASLGELRGRPVLLFFWAHWCGDCKQQAPVLAKLAEEYGRRGLVIIGPTQLYGYRARGEEATPEEELRYLDEVRQKFYGAVPGMAVPVSSENFRLWGASTTPTLVLIDRAGRVRLYHPGNLSYQELSPKIAALVR